MKKIFARRGKLGPTKNYGLVMKFQFIEDSGQYAKIVLFKYSKHFTSDNVR